MDYKNLCYRCFSEKNSGDRFCSECGYDNNEPPPKKGCLKKGSLLNNRYIVGMPLGVGGFGITYKCYDTKMGGICAIKEYLPSIYAMRSDDGRNLYVSDTNLSKFKKVFKRFVEEAELLRGLNHKNIINVFDLFYENKTVYYVMEYCDGIDLRRYVQNFHRKLEYKEGMNILFQVMDGLEYVHGAGILHRDIAPDNIYVTKNNFVKILDFGSARKEMEQANKELSVIIKMGYAPIEQYGGREKQGPYTDIYALGATFYHLFSSKTPVDSTQRVLEDKMTPLSVLRPDLPENLKYCLERAMAVRVSERIHNIAEMRYILNFNGDFRREEEKKHLAQNNNPQIKASKRYNNPNVMNTPSGYNNPNVMNAPSGYNNPNVMNAPSGYNNPNVMNVPSGYNNPNVMNTPLGYNNSNVMNTPLGYNNSNVMNTPLGYNNSNVMNVPSGYNNYNNYYTYSRGLYRASITSRAIAHIIDLGLYAFVYFFIAMAVAKSTSIFIIMWAAFPVLVLAVNILSELIAYTTIGKFFMKLCVRDINKDIPDVYSIVVRNVIKALEIFVYVFGKDGELLEDIHTDSVVYAKK